LRDRDPSALAFAADSLSDSVRRHVVLQYFFYRQMRSLLRFLTECGIEALTDIPMYPARDGFDTWRYRELFQLEPNGNPSHSRFLRELARTYGRN
jgi:4-alpha-glucanotransferase